MSKKADRMLVVMVVAVVFITIVKRAEEVNKAKNRINMSVPTHRKSDTNTQTRKLINFI